MANVMTTLWGLIAFAGFVVALLIPKTDEYRSKSESSMEDADREMAARWAAAVRTAPLAVMAGVLIIVVGGAATAGWGTRILQRTDFWLLVVAVLAQAGFVFTVRYLVAPVTAEYPRISPVGNPDLANLRSKGGGVKVSIRFDNNADEDMVLDWINFQGAVEDRLRGVIGQGSHVRRETYAGHLWRVSTQAGEPVAVFDAPDQPGVADVTSSMVPASPPSPGHITV
jgi:hypothetical protein